MQVILVFAEASVEVLVGHSIEDGRSIEVGRSIAVDRSIEVLADASVHFAGLDFVDFADSDAHVLTR